ncbi:alpha-amylase, partial [Xanthomonas perforans]
VGYLTDAFALKPMVRGVIDALRSNAALDFCDGDDASQQGQVCFEATPALATLDIPQDPEIRWLSAEQSNSSLVVADKAVFKLLRHVAVGANPEIEIGRRLTEMGYANAAPLLGSVSRIDAQGTVTTIALLQGFIRNQGDAWRWTLDHLARSFDEYATAQTDEARAEAVAGYDAFAAVVGKRLAELHEALSRATDDADFAPQRIDLPTANDV